MVEKDLSENTEEKKGGKEGDELKQDPEMMREREEVGKKHRAKVEQNLEASRGGELKDKIEEINEGLKAELGLVYRTKQTVNKIEKVKERLLKLTDFEAWKKIKEDGYIKGISIFFSGILALTLIFLISSGSIDIFQNEKLANRDYVLAIDNTYSMETPDYDASRLQTTKRSAETWLKSVSASEVALVSFSLKARTLTELTDDSERLTRELGSIEADLSSAGTSIGDAINLGVEILSQSRDRKEIIVITDGENSAGVNLSESVKNAEDNNISVNIIGIKSTGRTESVYTNLYRKLNLTGRSINVPRINVTRLSEAANQTGGEFYKVDDASGIKESLRRASLTEKRR